MDKGAQFAQRFPFRNVLRSTELSLDYVNKAIGQVLPLTYTLACLFRQKDFLTLTVVE